MDDLSSTMTSSYQVEAPDLGLLDPAITLVVATAFGVVVAMLHLLAHRDRPTYRLWRTLILIAPLIAMATMAVGTNLAAAFTLFGTLAIVRFRTPIKEPLDAVFVIFSVVIGLATGNQSFAVATIGTIVVAVTIAILLGVNKAGKRKSSGRIKLFLNTPSASRESWEAILHERGLGYRIRSCDVDRTLGTQTLTLEVFDVQTDDWPSILNALLGTPEVERASANPLDD